MPGCQRCHFRLKASDQGLENNIRRYRNSLAIIAGDALEREQPPCPRSTFLSHQWRTSISSLWSTLRCQRSLRTLETTDFQQRDRLCWHTELERDEGRQHQASEDHFVFRYWIEPQLTRLLSTSSRKCSVRRWRHCTSLCSVRCAPA